VKFERSRSQRPRFGPGYVPLGSNQALGDLFGTIQTSKRAAALNLPSIG
jgi:hypothetical protein